MPPDNLGASSPHSRASKAIILSLAALLAIAIGISVFARLHRSTRTYTSAFTVTRASATATSTFPAGGPALISWATSTAAQASLIDVTACDPVPLVAKSAFGAAMTFSNRDAKPHALVFGPGSIVIVPAMSTTSKRLDLRKNGGVWMYACDGKSQAGVIYIVK